MPGPPRPERSGSRKPENGSSARTAPERTRDRSGESKPRQVVVAAVWRGSYNRPARLVFFGDLHLCFHALQRLGPTPREVHWALLTGDITNFEDPPEAFPVVHTVQR